MKVYIAGKITGDDMYVAKFWQACEQLENEGFTVLDPSLLPSGMAPADYMRICLAMLDSADCVVLLPDWCQSIGARLEHAWCEYTGKPAVVWEKGMDADLVAKMVEEAGGDGK